MARLGIALLAGSAALLAAASGGAQSAPASVYLSGTTLRHVASDGQTNVVAISVSSGRIIVQDTAGLAAGEGCKQTNATKVSCTLPSTFVLDLKDGNDTLTNSSSVTIYAYGGPGNDVLNGGPGTDGLFAADGNDVLNGGGGNDILSGGTGNDVINGGAGDDRIDDDAGDDTIAAGAGNDVVYDYGGKDTISTDAGEDTVYSLDNTKDTINCGAGSDDYATDSNDLRSSCETSLN